MSVRKETVWCVDCGARFTDDETRGWGCPKCGSKGVPCGTDKDVTVEINWHELHILACWAENYAVSIGEDAPRTVASIARRLRQQWPALGPLTLGVELAELPQALADKGVKITGVQGINVPKPGLTVVNGPGAVGHSKMRRRKP